MRCDLGGKVAIVTGAAGTIGRGIVNRLTANGASVAIADINFEGAKALAAELPGSLGCRVDITSLDSTESVVAEVMARYGRVDILVNNAGINSLDHRVNIDKFPPHEWERIRAIDLDGLFLMSKAALEPMLAANQGGRVVNIASVLGLVVGHGLTGLIGSILEQRQSLPLTGWLWVPAEALVPLAALATAVVAALVPVLGAYRLDVTELLNAR